MNKREIIKALNANIPQDVVKQRKQAGISLDYLEGWYVIQKLNEIVGHDAWHQTIEVLDRQKGLDSKSRDTYEVIIKCRLEVRIEDQIIIREDVGFGNGLGLELAYKEACTDAFKRAARTLGYSMGLALYDKEKSKVGEPTVSKKDGREIFKSLETAIRKVKSVDELKQFWEDNVEVVKSLPEDWKQHIVAEKDRIKLVLTEVGDA